VADAWRTFVDTNVLVYAHNRSETRKQAIAEALLDDLWQSRAGTLSTQVLQGVLYRRDEEVRPIDESADGPGDRLPLR
jgi:predicted nucleic acid-binding protein